MLRFESKALRDKGGFTQAEALWKSESDGVEELLLSTGLGKGDPKKEGNGGENCKLRSK